VPAAQHPFIIVNPIAGDGRAGKLRPWLVSQLPRHDGTSIAVTTARGEAEELAREAIAAAQDLVLQERRVDPRSGDGQGDALDRVPPGLRASLERVPLAEGAVLIRQDEPPGDVFVLESGRLRVEMVTPEGTRMRLRTVLPGVVVGEIALYTGAARTAGVVAETPSVVLRLGRASIERLERSEPELAAALHRWLATTLSERLTETQRAAMALFD